MRGSVVTMIVFAWLKSGLHLSADKVLAGVTGLHIYVQELATPSKVAYIFYSNLAATPFTTLPLLPSLVASVSSRRISILVG